MMSTLTLTLKCNPFGTGTSKRMYHIYYSDLGEFTIVGYNVFEGADGGAMEDVKFGLRFGRGCKPNTARAR